MSARTTIVTSGMYAVLGITDYQHSQAQSNVFSGMPVHDILVDSKQRGGGTENKRLFLEDLFADQEFISETYTLSEDEIIKFGSVYDPQPFHTEPGKANELFFKGLSASGWQIAAVTMRLLVKSVPLDCGIIGLGADLTWIKPVRPKDTLRTRTKVVAIQASKSKPDSAVVSWFVETLNQHDETVQTMTTKTTVFSKTARTGKQLDRF